MVPWPGGQTGHCVQHVRAFLGSRLRVQCWLLAWLSAPHSAIRCSRCERDCQHFYRRPDHTNMFKSKWREQALRIGISSNPTGVQPSAVSLKPATRWPKRYSLPAFKFKQFYLADTKNDRIGLLTIALFQLQSWESITLRARWTRWVWVLLLQTIPLPPVHPSSILFFETFNFQSHQSNTIQKTNWFQNLQTGSN